MKKRSKKIQRQMEGLKYLLKDSCFMFTLIYIYIFICVFISNLNKVIPPRKIMVFPGAIDYLT